MLLAEQLQDNVKNYRAKLIAESFSSLNETYEIICELIEEESLKGKTSKTIMFYEDEKFIENEMYSNVTYDEKKISRFFGNKLAVIWFKDKLIDEGLNVKINYRSSCYAGCIILDLMIDWSTAK